MLLPFPLQGGGKKAITPLTVGAAVTDVIGTNTSLYNFGSNSVGTAPATGQRRFVFAYFTSMGNNSGANSTIPNYVRLDGVDMTNVNFVYDAGNGGTASSIWYLEDTAGTTASFSASLPGSSGRAGIVIWPVYSDDDGIAIREQLTSPLNLVTFSPALVAAGDVVLTGAANLAGGSGATMSGGYMTREGSRLVENTSYMAWAKIEEATGVSSPSITWDNPTADSNSEALVVIKPALAA